MKADPAASSGNYEGALSKNELERIAMPMLDSYDVVLCETSPGYVVHGPREEDARREVPDRG
jgi:hypothetical protein